MPPRVKEINALISSFSATYRSPRTSSLPPPLAVSPSSSSLYRQTFYPVIRFIFFTRSRVRSTRGNSLSRDLLGLCSPFPSSFIPLRPFIVFLSSFLLSFFLPSEWVQLAFFLKFFYKFFSERSKGSFQISNLTTQAASDSSSRVEFEI